MKLKSFIFCLKKSETYTLKFSQKGEFVEFKFKNSKSVDFITPICYPQSWLIVGVRARYDKNTKSGEKNARILRLDGIYTEPFCLGDGISKIMVQRLKDDIKGQNFAQNNGSSCENDLKNSKIHISYFDEGVYGNYGWVEPFGRAGYVIANMHGEKIYEYDGGVINDCYAMNLCGDKAFLHYYINFEFVSVDDSFMVQKYPIDFKGDEFAINENFVLFSKAYEGDKPYLYLFKFGEQLVPYKRLRLVLNEKFRYFGRASFGRFMLLISENFVYKIDLRDLK